MGETGVGKTAILSYLTELMGANFKIFDMHAGIQEQEIIEYIRKFDIEAQSPLNINKLNIVFFDEINTNDSVAGLLKEITIDRHLLGKPLSPNIRIVAALNPYKMKAVDANTNSAGLKLVAGNRGEYKQQ